MASPETSPPPNKVALPRPKSPPELYGRRRELAKVVMLEREIGFLQEELKSIETLQPASSCIKEVADYMVANPEPLISMCKKTRRSYRFWKWLCGSSCFHNISWFCCCCCGGCGCGCLEMPRCCCDTCPLPDCSCCSCPLPKCTCSCPFKPRCPRCLNPCSCCRCPQCPDCSCCCWPKRPTRPNCPDCSCGCWKGLISCWPKCSCPKRPKCHRHCCCSLDDCCYSCFQCC